MINEPASACLRALFFAQVCLMRRVPFWSAIACAEFPAASLGMINVCGWLYRWQQS
jgi:hypothetical protein